MTQTPVDSLVCTEPMPAPATVPACAAPREPPNTPSSPAICPSARPSKPCCAAATCSVFRMSNFTTYLVALELAHAQELARGVGVAEVVRERELVQQRPEVRALEHLEIGVGQLDLGEVRDVVRGELLQERRVVALDLARQHDQRRALLARVRVLDRLVHRPDRRLRWSSATSPCPRSDWRSIPRPSAAARSRATRRRISAMPNAGLIQVPPVRAFIVRSPSLLPRRKAREARVTSTSPAAGPERRFCNSRRRAWPRLRRPSR